LLEYDFEESIGYWVVTAARAFEQALNDELAPHGITYRQWQILGWLAYEGELSQASLAERLRIEAPTLAGILDRMERDGWISRHPSTADRRKKIIRPTTRGKPVWAKIAAAARRVRTQAVVGLTPAEVEQVKRLLGAIRDNLKARRPTRETVQ
jgi:MarR family transcriptional regulator for hemolysin